MASPVATVGGAAAAVGNAAGVTERPRPSFLWTWWRRAVDFDHEHPALTDLIATLVLAAVSVPWALQHSPRTISDWLFDAGLLVPLIWRRRHPEAVFAVIAAVACVQWFIGNPLVSDLALLAALFTIALERPLFRAIIAGAAVEVGVFMASFKWGLTDSWIRSLLALSGLAAAAFLFGAVLRTRRAHLQELTERAHRLEIERDQRAQMAAAEERTRIAREMHDVIAHSLAVVVAMADGASAKLSKDPEQAADAIRAISDVGRQALGDTRRLLGVLRERGGAGAAGGPPLAGEVGLGGTAGGAWSGGRGAALGSGAGPGAASAGFRAAGSGAAGSGAGPGAASAGYRAAGSGAAGSRAAWSGAGSRAAGDGWPGASAGRADLAPQPGLDQIGPLIDQLRATGLDAVLQTEGRPFPLPPGAELTVYRLLQEAGTNTLKHATGATRFTARLVYAYPRLRVEATDDGHSGAALSSGSSGSGSSGPVVPAVAPGSDRGAGHGLNGMRERVALYGGTVSAGPGPAGGWVVTAEIAA